MKKGIFIMAAGCLMLAVGSSVRAAAVFDFVDGVGFDARGVGARMTGQDGPAHVIMETVDIIGQDGSKATEGRAHKTNIYGKFSALGINDGELTGPEYSHFDSNEGWVFKFNADVNLVGINFSGLDAGDEMTMSSSAFPDFVFTGGNVHSLSNILVSAGTAITLQNTGPAGSAVRIKDLTVEAENLPDALGESENRPNVLFIAVDDLNDWVGAMGGHPQAITPHMDRLFNKGVLFSNAHASQPVCNASRNSLLSGIHPASSGWYGSTSSMAKNYNEVMAGNMMLPEYFRAHGYRTFAAGKIAHSGASDFKDKTDLYWDVVAPHFWKGMPEHIKDNGFGYRGYMFYPFPKNGGQLVQLYGEDAAMKRKLYHSLCGGPLDEEDIPEKGMFDEQIAAWTIEKLNTKHTAPFFLAAGFLRPHVPYAVPRRFFEMYDPDQLVLPDVPEDEMKDIPMYGKAHAWGYTPNGGWYDVSRKENMLKELVHSYLASVSFVDEQIGKVVDALEKSRYANNTVIVLWSDHGQHLGEKRHFRKQALWEESTHVPLFFFDPRDPRQGVCDEPVSLLDVYPTLVNVCGLPKNEKNEGRSIKPLIDDPDSEWEYPAVSTWKYGNYAVRSREWRYIQYRDGSEELYDHAKDPGEHTNLAGLPEYKAVVIEHKKWIPEQAALPAGTDEWNGDLYDERVKTWKENGVPEWLN